MMIRGLGASFGIGGVSGVSFGFGTLSAGAVPEVGVGLQLEDVFSAEFGSFGGFGNIAPQLAIQLTQISGSIGLNGFGFGLSIGAGMGCLGGLTGLGGLPSFAPIGSTGLSTPIGLGGVAPSFAMSPFSLRNSQLANGTLLNPMILIIILALLIALLAQRGGMYRPPIGPMGGLGMGSMIPTNVNITNININIGRLRGLPINRRRVLLRKLTILHKKLLSIPDRRRELAKMQIMISVLTGNVVI